MFKVSLSKVFSIAVAASMLTILLMVMISHPVVATSPGSLWLDGFSCRKSHDILPSAGAGTNYNVGIKVYNGTGTDGVEIVAGVEFGKVYANLSTWDLGEIRFTASDGLTILPFWKENYTANVSANFWVRVSDDLSTVTGRIYIYWGNHLAVDGSCGEATFQFYDHFKNNIWTVRGVNPDLAIPNTDWHYSEPSILYMGDPQILPSSSGNVFKLWYREQHHFAGTYYGTIVYRESLDGISWSGGITVLTASADPTGSNYALPDVHYIDSTYYMYIMANDGLGLNSGIDLYTSPDGVAWTKVKDNTLVLGTAGAWDDNCMGNRYVIKEAPGVWKMIYEARGDAGTERWKAGLATSTDGLTWTKYGGNPVLGAEPNYGGYTELHKVGSVYYTWGQHIWTNGPGWACTGMDRYSSSDLITWSRDSVSDIFPATLPTENAHIADPCMVEALGNIYMYYVGISTTSWNGLSYAVTGLNFEQLVQTKENSVYNKTMKWTGATWCMNVTASIAAVNGVDSDWRGMETIKSDFGPGISVRTNGHFQQAPASAAASRMMLNNEHWPTMATRQISMTNVSTESAIGVYDGTTESMPSDIEGSWRTYDINWVIGNCDIIRNGTPVMGSPLHTHVPVNTDMCIVYDARKASASFTVDYTFVRPYISSEPEHDGWGLLETYSSGGAVTITSSPVTTGSVSVTYSYQLVATGTGITWSFTSDAGWLSIDPVTGLLNGTPTATGTFYVNITATSGIYSDTQNYILTINDLAWIDDTMNMIMALVPILLLLALLGVCITVIGRRN